MAVSGLAPLTPRRREVYWHEYTTTSGATLQNKTSHEGVFVRCMKFDHPGLKFCLLIESTEDVNEMQTFNLQNRVRNNKYNV